MSNEDKHWTICIDCDGRGKKSKKIRKNVRLSYQLALNQFEKTTNKISTPIRPKGHLYACNNCIGTGLVNSSSATIADKETYPHVAIIGAGIGGVALAVACLHRKIPFTLYERDLNFNTRSQGYGLTLQQASKAIEELGISFLKEGVISTKHVVHTTDGKVIAEWGMRKWMPSHANKNTKRTNVHIARQSLRSALLEQLGENDKVNWGYKLLDFKQTNTDGIELNFEVDGNIKVVKTDLLVGADGIRSSVRRLLIGEDNLPLQYLGCMVILGICPLENLKDIENPLLDSATVFQTANGNERIYIMPYNSNSVMWQLSFPMLEIDAKALSAKGSEALKNEACRRTQWHEPIPKIIAATYETQISGYPVYDRELLKPKLLEKCGAVTLIGDAAHPMSPFKGQGANQALLDALSLAREIFKSCKPISEWRKVGLRENVLTNFESEMLERSSKKVKDSAEAAIFLHSEIALDESDEPRGRHRNKKT